MDFLRHLRWGLACLLTAAALAAADEEGAQSSPSGPAVEEAPKSTGPRDPSFFVILDGPDDLDALLQKIRKPDVEVRSVGPDGGSRVRGASAGPASARPRWIVEAVRVRGRVRGDSAVLRVELTIVDSSDESGWAPIRLDGQRIIDAREGKRILDLRMVEGDRWEVALSGRGPHRIEVELRCPVTTSPARASMSMAIPAAPSTSLELDFDRREPDLIVGANEVYGQSELPDGGGSRLSAWLTPRSRLEVSWAVDEGSGAGNPPLLTAQGDIAIDIGSEQLTTRSSWVIRCVRGMTRTLEVRVDDQDEVTELMLDDQSVGAGIEGGRGEGRLTIPLAEPLRPGGGEHRLLMMTRRPASREAGRRVTFNGFPIVHARQQTGAIGITQSANLWVSPSSSQGLRRIVPTFLPKELAERPGTSLAFEFLDQPFALALDVEASPPLVRSRSRTTFRLDGDRARSEATIELQWVRGRRFEVKLALGPGLEVTSVGPSSVVESWNLGGNAAASGGGSRQLTIRLSPTVRDQGTVSLRLQGSQELPGEGPVRLGLVAPEETTPVSSIYAIDAPPGLSVELDEEASRTGGSAGFTPAVADEPSGRTLSTSSASGPVEGLRLEAGGSPTSLPLRVTRRARTIRQETVLRAEVAPGWVDVRQETTLSVRHGAVAAIDLRVPRSIVGRWKLRNREAAGSDELGGDSGGASRYRLRFERPITDRVTLEFAWRAPIEPALGEAEGHEVSVPWLTFPEAEGGSPRVTLTTAPGVVIRGIDPSWAEGAMTTPTGSGGSGAGPSYIEATTGSGHPFRFRAVAPEPVPMPALLVPRLLVRSVLGPDGSMRFRAWFRVDAHGPSFPFALPEAAKIDVVRVDGRAEGQVDLDGDRGGSRLYRLRLPDEAPSRPTLIELQYHLDSTGDASRWQAPRVLDDGLVLQVLWEAWLPWDRTLLGVPDGWSDENEWSWGGQLWTRRPGRGPESLARWLLGDAAPATPTALDLPDAGADESRPLLFGRWAGRPGEPLEMAIRIVPRAWMVAACSGSALLVGFLALFSGIRFRTTWAVAAVVGLAAAAMLRPALAGQVAQASMIGVALTCLGLVTQHLIDRRRSRTLPGRETPSGIGTIRSDSSIDRTPVGSDEPTAIRVRTPSTLDYLPTPMNAPVATDEARSSTLGRS